MADVVENTLGNLPIAVTMLGRLLHSVSSVDEALLILDRVKNDNLAELEGEKPDQRHLGLVRLAILKTTKLKPFGMAAWNHACSFTSNGW